MSDPVISPTPPFGEDPKATAKAAKAYAKASRKWYQKKRWWLLAVVVVIAIASSASGGGGKNKPAVSDNNGAINDTGNTAPASSASAKPKPTPKSTAGQVLLKIHGSGMKTTQKFTAGGDWDLGYSYDCSNFGTQGNFQVYVYGSDGELSGIAANAIGRQGSEVDHEHKGGTYYLQVNSECNWTMKVTSAS